MLNPLFAIATTTPLLSIGGRKGSHHAYGGWFHHQLSLTQGKLSLTQGNQRLSFSDMSTSHPFRLLTITALLLMAVGVMSVSYGMDGKLANLVVEMEDSGEDECKDLFLHTFAPAVATPHRYSAATDVMVCFDVPSISRPNFDRGPPSV
tara:strand:+ start:43914 stop:44360 length:447 start_codon:yes stop_codon:yes gene_type:complete